MSRSQVFHTRIELFVRNFVASDVTVNLILMIAVIAEGVKNLAKGKMGQGLMNLFWAFACSPDFNDSANGSPSSLNQGLAIRNLTVGHNVTMFGRGRHVAFSLNAIAAF